MTTRRQHYVWQKYLEPWTTPRGAAYQLWCLRRETKKPFFTDTKNVAVERDFYRLQDLHEGDSDFIRWLGINPQAHPKVREYTEGWISRMEGFLDLMRNVKTLVGKNSTQMAELDAQMIEFQENQYGRMESDAVSQLAALQNGDVSFFNDDQQAMSFSHFIAHQYFRTKAIRDRIRNTFRTDTEKERFDRSWPIFRDIYATNVGYSIFAHRREMKLQVIHAADGMDFITADQPAINMHGAFLSPKTPVEEFELFYPVSPSRAVIISGHSIYDGAHGTMLAPFRMQYFNQAVEFVAYECLFARSEAPLTAIAPHFCSRPPAP